MSRRRPPVASLLRRRCLITGAKIEAGHVVNVSSAAGLLGLPWHAAYSAAKFGLLGVSEVLRDRYLVFTSADIRVTFLAQRYFPRAYELAMRRLNDHLTAVARSAS